MGKKTSDQKPNLAHEIALEVIRSAVKDGTFSEAHKVELNRLAESEIRPKVSNAFRAEVQKIKYPVISGPREMRRLIASLRLEEGYNAARETQHFFELLKTGQRAPDFGKVLKTFTPEKLAAAESLHEPRLLLITQGRSFDDLVSAVDSHRTIRAQNTIHKDDLYRSHSGRKQERWSAWIVDGSREMKILDEFDDKTLILRERLRSFGDYKEITGLSGMNRWKCIHLIMQGLVDNKPLDPGYTWTMLDEDPVLSNSFVPYVVWTPGRQQVYFHGVHSGFGFGNSRFRRSVGGDVPNV